MEYLVEGHRQTILLDSSGTVMKAIKIILGTVFGLYAAFLLWPLTYLVKEWAAAGYSSQKFTDTGAVLGELCISTMLAIWAFRSAFRKPNYSRRWYQFSLRWLLVFGPLATICVSWLIVAGREYDRRHAIKMEAVTAIEKSGGKVPSWQRDDLETFGWVVLKSDAGLKSLSSQPHLGEITCDTLNIEGSQVTDVGLEYLKVWVQVRDLNLRDSRITGSGLQHLQALPQLRSLSLRRTGVTAASLEYLKGVPTLKWLYLDGPTITDAHLQHLKACVQLQDLTLVDTSVTDQGIRDLQAALPTCKIDRRRR